MRKSNWQINARNKKRNKLQKSILKIINRSELNSLNIKFTYQIMSFQILHEINVGTSVHGYWLSGVVGSKSCAKKL